MWQNQKQKLIIESVRVHIHQVVHHRIQTHLIQVQILKREKENENESIRSRRNQKNPRKKRRQRSKKNDFSMFATDRKYFLFL